MNQLFKSIQTLIEKNTNFEPSDLLLRSEKNEEIQIFIKTFTSLDFKAVTSKVSGKLKPEVSKVSKVDFNKALLDLVETNRTQSIYTIQAWMKTHGQLLRSTPTSEEVVKEKLLIGFDENCHNCNGYGEVGCNTCGKSGQITCLKCGGRGAITCYGCHGSGKGRCSKCHGNGRNGNTYCSICKGSGQGGCNTCGGLFGGSGRIQCPACHGRQKVSCNSCSGSGKHDCVTCNSTGNLSTVGKTECYSTLKHEFTVECINKETDDFLKILDLQGLESLATIRFQDFNDFNIGNLERNYNASILVSEIDFDISGKENSTFHIQAYGPNFEVFDYKNLFAKLLEDDARMLENALTLHNIFSRVKTNDLVYAARKFMQSEIHVEIADAAVTGKLYSQINLSGKYSETFARDRTFPVNLCAMR